MCAIFGVITNGQVDAEVIHKHIDLLLACGSIRGRDGLGVHFAIGDLYAYYKTTKKVATTEYMTCTKKISKFSLKNPNFTMIGNCRAEPTTEWVKDKELYDQQPYSVGPWSIVHNGTIANDKDLRTYDLETTIDSAAIVEQLNLECGASEVDIDYAYEAFIRVIKKLKGSYAILATNSNFPGYVFTACNYRPIWMGRNHTGVFFASQREALPDNSIPQMLKPYTCNLISYTDHTSNVVSLYDDGDNKKKRALVVASGGMDSTVAAKMIQNTGMDITLINFQYGCRAETNELRAIHNIAEDMHVPLVLFPLPIYDPKDSPLFNVDAEIAGGEAGAEFAHEWVPARNLVMLSIATAYAEANGFDYIVLGNNLEEAGAYPDNEPEFINHFNAMLPFAVGDGKRVKVIMPVGNLMKHEIVAQGLAHAAPLHLTWSCYRNNEHHCGTCGPCMMRKTAFAINNAEEVIKYND